MVKLNIGVLQLNPRIGSVRANIEQANSILATHGYPIFFSGVSGHSGTGGSPRSRKSIDILVLPELAFTGYNFKSPTEIKPFLEPTTAGVSTEWARHASRSLGCHVLVGYPEKFVHNISIGKEDLQKTLVGDAGTASKDSGKTSQVAGQIPTVSDTPTAENNDDYTIYNSAVMVSPTGKVLFNYRKSFLYSTDEIWGCSESPDMKDGPDGPGVFPLTGTIYLDKNRHMDPWRKDTLRSEYPGYSRRPTESGVPTGTSSNSENTSPTESESSSPTTQDNELDEENLIPLKVQVGICMDLNPYKFTAPFEKYEFGQAALNNDASLVLCPMAWLHNNSPDTMTREVYEKQTKSLKTTFESVFSGSPLTYEQYLDKALAKVKEELENNPNSEGKSNVRYWVQRLSPLYESTKNKKRGLVTCNRSGIEDYTVFGGSSSIYTIKPGSVSWYGSLGQNVEDLMVREIEVDE